MKKIKKGFNARVAKGAIDAKEQRRREAMRRTDAADGYVYRAI